MSQDETMEILKRPIVSRNDILEKILSEFKLDPPPKKKKVDMQIMIADYMKQNPDKDPFFRELVDKLTNDFKSQKQSETEKAKSQTTELQNQTPSPLETQPSLPQQNTLPSPQNTTPSQQSSSPSQQSSLPSQLSLSNA